MVKYRRDRFNEAGVKPKPVIDSRNSITQARSAAQPFNGSGMDITAALINPATPVLSFSSEKPMGSLKNHYIIVVRPQSGIQKLRLDNQIRF
jgi:hypothetical protein